jgi:hypothetical protein
LVPGIFFVVFLFPAGLFRRGVPDIFSGARGSAFGAVHSVGVSWAFLQDKPPCAAIGGLSYKNAHEARMRYMLQRKRALYSGTNVATPAGEGLLIQGIRFTGNPSMTDCTCPEWVFIPPPKGGKCSKV